MLFIAGHCGQFLSNDRLAQSSNNWAIPSTMVARDIWTPGLSHNLQINGLNVEDNPVKYRGGRVKEQYIYVCVYSINKHEIE